MVDQPPPGDAAGPEPELPVEPAPVTAPPEAAAGAARSEASMIPPVTPSAPPTGAVGLPATAAVTAVDRPPGGDWAATVADTIENYVGLVRDRTTKPALVVTRAVVFGVMLAILGVAAVVLLWIAWITAITALVGEVWITDLITGGIFVLVGAFLMAKRKPPELEL
jgi:hypothetical protein